jgi:serine/threonine protein phosphatase PrpC
VNHDIGSASLAGDRAVNQDRFGAVLQNHRALLVVADGMGGHPRGEAAAQILVAGCEREFRNAGDADLDPCPFLEGVLQKTHRAITAYGEAQEPPVDPRTTAVVAMIQNATATWAHVGDSRFYLLREGRIYLRTEDHSYVEELRRQGILSAAECRKHPYRNFVTRCVGGSMPLETTISTPTPLQAGDILLLCSDGAWGPLDDRTITRILKRDTGMEQAVQALVDEAYRRGRPENDNITAIALRWQG